MFYYAVSLIVIYVPSLMDQALAIYVTTKECLVCMGLWTERVLVLRADINVSDAPNVISTTKVEFKDACDSMSAFPCPLYPSPDSTWSHRMFIRLVQ